MKDVILSPTDFVALVNQTLEFAYPVVSIEGELANFKVSRNAWVYFDVKDELASVKFFGSVFKLPGPLQDGLRVRVIGQPKLHPQFGFSITFSAVQPVGEGSIKKAADLLRAKLETEGLFAPERKRLLPELPLRIGLITAAASAACADFIKILNERWGGVEVLLADVPVQGEAAVDQIVSAINYFNMLSPNMLSSHFDAAQGAGEKRSEVYRQYIERVPQPATPRGAKSSSRVGGFADEQADAVWRQQVDVLVITRGGGSAEDLAAFNDERVVRAIAGSRTPTLVAIGHEVDISLAELAADMRASTPTNAAQVVVPNRAHVISQLKAAGISLHKSLLGYIASDLRDTVEKRKYLTSQVFSLFDRLKQSAVSTRKLLAVFDPAAALRRGYAIVKKGGAHIKSVGQVSAGDRLAIQLSDGKISAKVAGSK